jgi:hypothetical protein
MVNPKRQHYNAAALQYLITEWRQSYNSLWKILSGKEYSHVSILLMAQDAYQAIHSGSTPTPFLCP